MFTDFADEYLEPFRKFNIEVRKMSADANGNFKRHSYYETAGVPFPEMEVLARKIDILSLLDSNVLFLDVDTEVRSSLNAIITSNQVHFHDREYVFSNSAIVEHMNIFTQVDWHKYQINVLPSNTFMYNTGVIYIPKVVKCYLKDVRNLMLDLEDVRTGETNRLNEQIAISIILQHRVGLIQTASHLVKHFWSEKYDLKKIWYNPLFHNNT
jgi:hypothetical protein